MKYLSIRRVRKRPGIIPVFFLSVCTGILAQDVTYSVATSGLGGCYATADPGGGMLINEASLGELTIPEFTASHARPFVSRELGVSGIFAAVPVANGSFCFSLNQCGIPDFRQFSEHTGFGMRLSESLSAGIGFHLVHIASVSDWNYLWRLGVSGGIRYTPYRKTTLAFHFYNPFSIHNYPGYGIPGNTILSFGMAREVYRDTRWYVESEYSLRKGFRLKTALHAMLTGMFSLGAGFHTNPFSLSFSPGFSMGKCQLLFVTSYSPLLGFTPAFQVRYQPAK